MRGTSWILAAFCDPRGCGVGLVAASIVTMSFSLACEERERPTLQSQAKPSAATTPSTQTRLAEAAQAPVEAQPPAGNTISSASSERASRAAYDRWVPLITTGLTDQARALCTGWLESSQLSLQVEGHKCLANVEISTSRLPASGSLAPSATKLQPRNSRAGTDSALAHYQQAITLSPLEVDSHVGRMDVLILAERYDEANAALDETLSAFASRETLDNWFRLLARFRQLGRFEQALAFLEVMEKHHPMDHRIVANLGAYYALLKRHDKALSYAKQAVTLAPDDPINQWNLARLYDQRGELSRADTTYLQALALFRDSDPRARCDYAEFLAIRLKDRPRSCAFARSECSEHFDQHCGDNG